MILGLFRRKKHDETIGTLYGAIVAQSRNPIFYREHGVPDTVDGRFEMIVLHLRDGVWDGQRILPEGWVDHGRRVRSEDPTDGSLYGAHWWIDQLDLERGTFRASGYEGQAVAICPALDAVAARLGRTPEALVPSLPPWRRRLFDALS